MLQKTMSIIVDVNEKINESDAKYDDAYYNEISRNVNSLNKSNRALYNELKILFNTEETLFHLVKYHLIHNYTEMFN